MFISCLRKSRGKRSTASGFVTCSQNSPPKKIARRIFPLKSEKEPRMETLRPKRVENIQKQSQCLSQTALCASFQHCLPSSEKHFRNINRIYIIVIEFCWFGLGYFTGSQNCYEKKIDQSIRFTHHWTLPLRLHLEQHLRGIRKLPLGQNIWITREIRFRIVPLFCH